MAKALKVTTTGLSTGGFKPLQMEGITFPRELEDFAQIFLVDGSSTQQLLAGVKAPFAAFIAAGASQGEAQADPGNGRIILGKAGIWLVTFQCSVDISPPPSDLIFQAEVGSIPVPQAKCKDSFTTNKIDSSSFLGMVSVSSVPVGLGIGVESDKNVDVCSVDTQLCAMRIG